MQLQGGGGSHCGALATDDNAADARTGPREPGLARTTGPSMQRTPHTVRLKRPRGRPWARKARNRPRRPSV
ncbi:hypothetical protein DBP21_27305 [Streptomyces sp. CS147]|nr:hypothetical protein DBP21_27305 [Streptomyces sp. CS147]